MIMLSPNLPASPSSFAFTVPPSSNEADRPLRILSLDGGGARGIVALKVLERIFDTPDLQSVNPCDFFDLIVGTSTGGIVAVLLGRLELSIAESLKIYNELTPVIFAPSIYPRFPRYSTSNFEEQIKKVISTYHAEDEDAPLWRPDGKCSVALVAAKADEADGRKELFRSYDLPSKSAQTSPSYTTSKDLPIWKAVRATSAAPTFFRSMEIEGVNYVDGGILANNPAMVAISEAKRRFPGRRIGALYSLGTGVSKSANAMVDSAFSLIGFVRDELSKMITSTREDEAEANERCQELGITYFRFDPPFVGDQPMDTPDLEVMLMHTSDYLEQPEQIYKLRASQKISSEFAAGRVPVVAMSVS